MEIKDRISQWVDSHRAELLRDIGRLVAVKSVRGEPAEGAPFGPGPRRALDEALALCGEYGFETKMYGGAVGAAFFSEKPSALDILGHLDVVGEGEGWDTDPYTATEKDDGCLYGRGTDDDKGPIVIALYALRCLKELGVELSHGIRLIMGTDEESGSGDLPYFYNTNAPAPNTVTPDTGFPVYNTEKGRWAPSLSAAWAKSDALPRVAALNGGFRVNVIPGDATALVLGLDADTALWAAHEAAGKYGVDLLCEPAGDGVRLSVHGTQGHAAYPDGANNALTALLGIVAALPLSPDAPANAAVRALADLFPHGAYGGEGLGIDQADELSGPLTASLNVIDLGEEGLTGKLDCRVPICATYENCCAVAMKAMAAAGISASGELTAPHHTPGDGEFVQTLLRCYETYSGRRGECLRTGGGTYVHDIEGGVGFGISMPGFESNLHGANERINIQDALTAVKIFALAAHDICK